MMMLGLALLWIGWIALGIVGVRALFPLHSHRASQTESGRPLDILAQRYASGEIDRDTYELIRSDITDHEREE